MLWLLIVPAIALALLSLRGEGARRQYITERLRTVDCEWPPATVIVPVKGEDEDLRGNLAALASLDYPSYELLVVARTADDIPPNVLPARVRVVLAGDRDLEAGAKVRNLIAGVRAARRVSEVFAFADSDGRVQPGWLRALVAPLTDVGVGAVTGFRWHTPEPVHLWSLLRSLWNAVAFGTFGPGANRFVWGGAMALRKETFFDARVLEAWRTAVSDDYALSAAVRSAGFTIAWAPGATVAAPDHTGPGELLHWIRRQMLITRVHEPELWAKATIAHLVYAAGMLAAVEMIALGDRLGWAALAAQLGPGMVKGAWRARNARRCLPKWDGWFARHGWIYSVGTPIGTWLWMYSLAVSAFGSTIRWRGHEYLLRRPASRPPAQG